MRIVEGRPSLDAAVQVTSKGFIQPISEELVRDVDNHLVGDLVFQLLDGESLVGFATFRINGNLLYLNGVMIDPAFQGREIARRVIREAQKKVQAAYLGLRTQSAVMWASGKAVCTSWIPIADKPIDYDPELHQQAVAAAELCGSPSIINPGYFGTPLYGDKPIHRDPAIQRWWDSICCFEAGDAIVCAGRF